MVSFGDGVTFVVVLHQVWKKHPVHQDFLGFYVADSRRMSAQTHGLLGMECSSFRWFRTRGRGRAMNQHTAPQPACAPTLAEAVLPVVMAGADGVNVFIPRTILPPL